MVLPPPTSFTTSSLDRQNLEKEVFVGRSMEKLEMKVKSVDRRGDVSIVQPRKKNAHKEAAAGDITYISCILLPQTLDLKVISLSRRPSKDISVK